MGSSHDPFGVLFDIDDTLVDFSGAARSALLDVAVSFDVRPPGPTGGTVSSSQELGERVLRCWEMVSEREYGRFLAGELGFDEMLIARMTAVIGEMDPLGALGLDPAELEMQRNRSIFTHYRLFDDVLPTVERLRDSGVRMGVLSNSDGDYQRRKMVAAGLHGLLDAAVFSGDLGVSKPDAAIFLAGAATLRLPAARVVYVGDRWSTDSVGALGAGLSAIWLNRAGLPRPDGAAEDLRSIPGSGPRLVELTGLEPLDAALARGLLVP